jgi:hypothetical protein
MLNIPESVSQHGGTQRANVSNQPETRTVDGKEVEIHTWDGPGDKDNPYAQAMNY